MWGKVARLRSRSFFLRHTHRYRFTAVHVVHWIRFRVRVRVRVTVAHIFTATVARPKKEMKNPCALQASYHDTRY